MSFYSATVKMKYLPPGSHEPINIEINIPPYMIYARNQQHAEDAALEIVHKFMSNEVFDIRNTKVEVNVSFESV